MMKKVMQAIAMMGFLLLLNYFIISDYRASRPDIYGTAVASTAREKINLNGSTFYRDDLAQASDSAPGDELDYDALYNNERNELSEPITLAFVGDILLARHPGMIMRDTDNVKYPFEKTAAILKKADLTFGNLECVLSGNRVLGNVYGHGRRYYCFKTLPKFVDALTYAGIDAVTLANNHAMNGGKQGMLDTIATLKSRGIQYVGGGANIAEARKCAIIEVKGKKIGFLGRASVIEGPAGKNYPGTAPLSREIFDAVKACRLKVDILVTTFHWSVEQLTVPRAQEKKLAHDLIDSGVDIVIGHHPHVLQPIEIYKGKTIAYSLGNFVFDNTWKLWSTTMILKIVVLPDGTQKVSTIPCYIKQCQPQITGPEITIK